MGGSSGATSKEVFAGESFGEVVLRGRVWFGPPFLPSLPGVAALPGRAPPSQLPAANPE